MKVIVIKDKDYLTKEILLEESLESFDEKLNYYR